MGVSALLAEDAAEVVVNRELVYLSDFVSRLGLPGDYLCTPFEAVTENATVTVYAVLERTAVVCEASGERRLMRQADLSIDPLGVRWRRRVQRRRASELIASHLPSLRRCPDCGRTPAQTRFYDLSRTYCSDCQRRRQRPERAPSLPAAAAKGAAEVSPRRLAQERAAHLADSREETDRCHARSCEVGTRRHQHCCCGLPMRGGAAVCRWCDAEGLDPTPDGEMPDEEDPFAWDGRRYPSRRRRRISAPDEEGLRRLLVAVLADCERLVDAGSCFEHAEPRLRNHSEQGKANGLSAGWSASIECEG
jgi:hypothetical protein